MASSRSQLLKGTSPKAGGTPPAPGPQDIIAQIEEQAKRLPIWALDRIATSLDQMSTDAHLRIEESYREHRRLNEEWRAAVERDPDPNEPPTYTIGEILQMERETEEALADPDYPFK